MSQLRFRKWEGVEYPFALDGMQFQVVAEGLELEDLLRLADEIDVLLYPPEHYVKVKIVGHDEREWYYEDPGFELKKDDLVRVNWGGATKIGIVRHADALPPSWLLQPRVEIKPVEAKFTAEEL